jgi:hypothetical protein
MTVKKWWQSNEVFGAKGGIRSSGRLIIVPLFHTRVWKPQLVFRLGTTGDYQMNKGNFEKWLTEHLFPNIPSGCVIIMDNAPYHWQRMNKPPVKSSTKKTVVECLIKNNILRVRLWFAKMWFSSHLATQPRENKIDELVKTWQQNRTESHQLWLNVNFVDHDSQVGSVRRLKKSCELRSNANLFLGPSPQTTFSFAGFSSEITKTKKTECRLALFIAQHTAINLTDHLIDVCKTSFVKDAQQMQMHRTKCSNIIKNVLAPYFVENLKADLGNNKFSLLLDESTDISTQKYLGIVIIY